MLKSIAVAAFLLLAPLAAVAKTLGVFASFSQTGQTSMTATTTSSRTPFASTAPVAWVCNFGNVTAYVGTRNAGNLGTPVTVANGFPIPPALCVSLTATGFTNLAAITASGTASLSISTGTGWPSAAPTGTTVAISGTVPVSGTFWPYALGQTTRSASVPVTIASDQTGVPVTGTFFQATQPVSGSVSAIPTSSAVTETPVTVTASSAQVLAAGSRLYLYLENLSATAIIACRFAAAAALNTAGSFSLLPYASKTWESSYVPSDAINCIASASSVPLTVLSK